MVPREIHQRLMLETLRRMRVIEGMKPREYSLRHQQSDHAWELAEGPRWRPSEWFPSDCSPAACKRWQRALYDLLDAGLLTGGAGGWNGQRLTNIKLTDEGRALAIETEVTR